MNPTPIERQFERLGVRIKIRPTASTGGAAEDYSLDVRRDREGDHFVLTVAAARQAALEAQVLQNRPAEKHLLLMVRNEGDIDRFLCGHDEREWFVAAIPDAVSTVDAAMESLKPGPVRLAQVRAGLNARERKRRKNDAFRRQGEWFFLPCPGLDVDEKLVLRWEPIARTGGKPHMVQFLVRSGGQLVYTSSRQPGWISAEAHHRLVRRRPGAASWKWHARRINPRVFAKGEIRHPDHRTIALQEWHEVLMNTEHQSPTMRNVAFLD